MRPGEVAVRRVTVAGPEVVLAVRRLLPQLTRERPAPGQAELAALVADPGLTLLAARRDGEIVGLALVVRYRKLTGVAARLEDVVVDRDARGAGVGEALVAAAIEAARRGGALRMELTSSPARETANRLYPRLGFSRRETIVFTLEL